MQTVCEFCRSVVVRHDVQLELVGRVADLPATPSPVQLGTEGRHGTRPFVVTGRILYEYEAGVWSEWHLQFSDGRSGWLSDAMLEYAVTERAEPGASLPDATAVPVGQQFEWGGQRYMVVSVTQARYRGVEGELPFEYWDKTETPFVDLRGHKGEFATIDYSESPPLLFTGSAVEFDDLAFVNLRHFDGWE